MRNKVTNLSAPFERWIDNNFPDWTKSKLKKLLLYALAVSAVFYSLFPLFWMIITSFQPRTGIFHYPPEINPAYLTLENYMRVANHERFIRYYVNSVIVATTTTVATIIISVFGAYSISRFNYRGSDMIDNSILLVYMFPPIVLVIPISIIIVNWVGLGNTWHGLSLVYLTFAIPFSIWLLREFFEGIPFSLEESAMIDGASRMEAFYHVVLPNTLPGIIATAIFTWSLAWNEYLYASVIMSNTSMQTLPVGLTQMLNTPNAPWGMFMAAATLVTAPILVLFILVQDYLVKGFGTGGTKG